MYNPRLPGAARRRAAHRRCRQGAVPIRALAAILKAASLSRTCSRRQAALVSRPRSASTVRVCGDERAQVANQKAPWRGQAQASTWPAPCAGRTASQRSARCIRAEASAAQEIDSHAGSARAVTDPAEHQGPLPTAFDAPEPQHRVVTLPVPQLFDRPPASVTGVEPTPVDTDDPVLAARLLDARRQIESLAGDNIDKARLWHETARMVLHAEQQLQAQSIRGPAHGRR
jgi:hypothetical protein